MTFIEKQIAKNKASDPEFLAAFVEEEENLAKELEHRRELMATVIAIRKAQGLSQVQLARKLKVSQARVSQMERGNASLSVDHLLQIVEELKGSIVILSPEEVESYGLQNRLVSTGQRILRSKKVRSVPAKAS
jgi:predicted XRE-type DNA-binding protein